MLSSLYPCPLAKQCFLLTRISSLRAHSRSLFVHHLNRDVSSDTLQHEHLSERLNENTPMIGVFAY